MFKTNLGSIIAPIKKPPNAIMITICKSLDTGSVARSKKRVNVTKTIRGENISSFNILLLLKKDKNFSLGYKPLKKLFVHSSSINPSKLKISVKIRDFLSISSIFLVIVLVIEYIKLIFSRFNF